MRRGIVRLTWERLQVLRGTVEGNTAGLERCNEQMLDYGKRLWSVEKKLGALMVTVSRMQAAVRQSSRARRVARY